MPAWWDEWLGRREHEIDSFERNGMAVDVDDTALDEGRLVLRTLIDVDGEDIAIEVRYPDHYPWTRFVVYAPDLNLARHQNPFDSNLCVFPRASVHWHPRYLAGDIVAERVPELIRAVRAGGGVLRAAEEPQAEPYTDYFAYVPAGAVLVPAEVSAAAAALDGGQFTIRMSGSADWVTGDGATDLIPAGNGLLAELRRGQAQLAVAEKALLDAFPGPNVVGQWVRLASPPRGPQIREFMEGLAADAPAIVEPEGAAVHYIGVVFEEEVRQGEYADAWIFAAVRRNSSERPGPRDPRRAIERSGWLLRGARCSLEQMTERVPELASLRSRSVSIVGIGSLGAPLAVELARGTVGALRLGDPDFVDPGTIVRWEGGLTSAGANKALVLAQRLRRDHPYTRTEPHPLLVGNVAGDREDIDAWLADADLVVDATAEDNVTAVIAHRAWQAGIPFLTFWSIEGAGGIVARLIPGETGCYHCLRLHTSAEEDPTIEMPRPYGAARVQPRGCADPTFTATSADLRPVVDQAVRVAFGELCRGHDPAYPRHASDVQVLFLRNEDGSLREPLYWTVHQLPVHPRCPLVHAAAD